VRQPAPEVTFLVVAYNHPAYVEQCLDSIAAQATAWRAIIVDDTSTDGRRVLDTWR
jgi:glycosyltransferase involved in cell wall biosynthesis